MKNSTINLDKDQTEKHPSVEIPKEGITQTQPDITYCTKQTDILEQPKF